MFAGASALLLWVEAGSGVGIRAWLRQHTLILVAGPLSVVPAVFCRPVSEVIRSVSLMHVRPFCLPHALSGRVQVNGCPKTIDGDLKNEYVPISFGFDTAAKTFRCTYDAR